MILQGDCLIKLKELDDNSVDSIVTDPPYELGFMGKSWDSTGIANNKEMWKECLRVLKPGGHLLSFGGTRTYHRMACAIEDAGFEVRDIIEWVYGSGFPKSLNIGKAVDKIQGNERREIGTYAENAIDGSNRTKNPNIRQVNFGASDVWNKQITRGTSEWEGWGTALKPAHEPICMARKPIECKTVAENCLKWGTGGINIDESRVEIPENDKENYEFNNNGLSRMSRPEGDKLGQFDGGWKIDKTKRETPHGRFPANLLHDNSEEVRECFPEAKGMSGGGKHKQTYNKDGVIAGGGHDGNESHIRGDSGNASRFFKSIIYQSKASKSERNKGCEELEEKDKAGKEFRPNHAVKAELGEDGNPFGRWGKIQNNHPTVKPIALMEYLIKMVTPKGGTVLDPFMGSGSTGVACKENGYEFIGIEMEADYCKIAEARINSVVSKLI